jgi:gamma-glutamylcyclotransferase (GGCT)/AIG2-like uncharacterized protein YtfP
VIDGFGEPAEPAPESASGRAAEAGSSHGQQKEALAPSHRWIYDTAVHLFVYGSLKRGQGRLADLLWERADFAGNATVKGRLYRVGRYAGLVWGEGVVHGELARLREAEHLLRELDAYEGEEYERVRCKACVETGGTVEAMVYLYRGSLEAAEAIASGYWPEMRSE